eukprot:Skav219027  [mRNA]  locus=scaffold2722:9053:9658:- [translate_table: standard]
MSVLRGHDSLDAYNQHTFKVMPMLHGGGKSVQKKTKEKRLKLVEKLRADVVEKSQTIQNVHLRNMPAVKSVEAKMNEMMQTADKNPEEAMKKLALDCGNVEKLNECIVLLDRSDKSMAVSNTVEGRLKRVAKIIYGDAGQEVFKVKEEIDSITETMNYALQYLYMKTSTSSENFDIGDFRTMLISARSFIEGKNAGSDDML